MQLTITPLKVQGKKVYYFYLLVGAIILFVEIPSEDSILEAAQNILDSIPTWKKGKTYYKTVKTYSRPKEPQDGAPWHCRISQHGSEDATFDEFWKGLGENKAENEKEYNIYFKINTMLAEM